MRIVFMGSAPLACACLEALLEEFPGELVGLVCQPDRPRGRNLKMASCPVKERAGSLGLPVFTPANVSTEESVAAIRTLAPDLVVVVAYGQILRPSVLDLPALGCVNIHASLLPHYRGAAPIQWAIASGETETGVTAMFMNERMDAGDIILQRRVAIGPEETSSSLHEHLAREGALALLETVERFRTGTVESIPQDESAATFAPKLSREDGRVDWTLPARTLYNRVRGFTPWPGTFCEARGARGRAYSLKVIRVRVEPRPPATEDESCGVVLDAEGDGPLVAAGRDALRLLDVQPEGRNAMSGAAFLRGHPVEVGRRLAPGPGGETRRGEGA